MFLRTLDVRGDAMRCAPLASTIAPATESPFLFLLLLKMGGEKEKEKAKKWWFGSSLRHFKTVRYLNRLLSYDNTIHRFSVPCELGVLPPDVL